MSFEQAVVQLEQTNSKLQEEVVRFRDAAMGLNNIYPTITEGRQNTADGKYFSVPGDGTYMRLYRRNGTSSTLIAEYPSVAAMIAAINEAVAGAEARANAAADRAEVYADNKEFVVLERFRKQATLGLDFASGDYSLDDGDKLRTTNATDFLTVERVTPKWVFGPDGKLREVPPNTVARHWGPDGEPLGALFEETRTNLSTNSNFLAGWGTTGLSEELVTAIDYTGKEASLKKWVPSTVGESHFVYQGYWDVSPNTVYTQSVWVPTNADYSLRFIYRSTSTAPVNSNTNPEIIEIRNGWVRRAYTFTTPGDCNDLQLRLYLYSGNDISFAGDGVKGVIFSGHQLEKGHNASSNIPVDNSFVTRAADEVFSDTTLTGLSNGFTWYKEIFITGERTDSDNTDGFGSVSFNGGSKDFISLAMRTDSPRLRYVVSQEGGVSFNLDVFVNNTTTIGRWHKVAISVRDGRIIACANGASVVESFEHVPSLLGKLNYYNETGYYNYKSRPGLSMSRESFIVPRPSTAAELQELTS